MVAVRRFGASAALALVAAPLLLVGCAPTTPSWITVEYVVDGAERSVTMRPETVSCSELSVGGIAIVNEPVGQFTFVPATGDDPPRVRGGVAVGDDTLYVESADILFEAAGDGVFDVAASDVDAAIVENPDELEDAAETAGTLTAHLVCSPAD